MIKLTGQDGKPIYISPEQIASTQESGGILTRVYIAGVIEDTFLVKESPEEVVRKIMDYKLAMQRYVTSSHAAYYHYAEDGNNPYTPPLDQVLIFNKLAGLEQTP